MKRFYFVTFIPAPRPWMYTVHTLWTVSIGRPLKTAKITTFTWNEQSSHCEKTRRIDPEFFPSGVLLQVFSIPREANDITLKSNTTLLIITMKDKGRGLDRRLNKLGNTSRHCDNSSLSMRTLEEQQKKERQKAEAAKQQKQQQFIIREIIALVSANEDDVFKRVGNTPGVDLTNRKETHYLLTLQR